MEGLALENAIDPRGVRLGEVAAARTQRGQHVVRAAEIDRSRDVFPADRASQQAIQTADDATALIYR